MDRRIQNSSRKKWVRGILAVSVIAALGLTLHLLASDRATGQSVDVAMRSLVVDEVARVDFEESLVARGTIRPKTSIFLDAVVGGRVEARYVEQGEYVKEGQVLAELSNASLQLEVISREAQISEQLNFLRNTQMQAETNRLDLRRSLLDAENEIAHRKREIRQTRPLVERNMLPSGRLEELEQELKYYEGRRTLVLERQEQEERIRTVQLAQLEDSAEKLEENLEFARGNLASLIVSAPVDGYLSELNIELGESKAAGERLGQIDIPGAYKVSTTLDEYYLQNLSLRQLARIRFQNEEIVSSISKIDSRVRNSEFVVEIDIPEGVDQSRFTSGQSVDVEIVMGSMSQPSLAIEKGSFVNQTGGNWIFVLDSEGRRATRRQITLGKQNRNQFQIINGLDLGERVIISSYSSFDNADTLNLQ